MSNGDDLAEYWRSRHLEDVAVLSMIKDAIGELFGPVAYLESDEAHLLRGGPETTYDGDAIVEALMRVSDRLDALTASRPLVLSSSRPLAPSVPDRSEVTADRPFAGPRSGVL